MSLAMLFFASCYRASPAPNAPAEPLATNRNQTANCVNLNTASAEELNKLPGIGEAMAQKIMDYRQRHKGFRRPQELILIEGFSEKKYRALADLVCVQ